MPVELSHLMQLALGQKPSLPVGDLPWEVAKYLGCHPAIVYLGQRALLKIAVKHPVVTYHEVQYLPYMISDGQYVADRKRKDCVMVFDTNPEDGKLYMAALKTTDRGGEVWVSSLYRSRPKQEARKIKAGHIIRPYRRK